jgi:hypothetical protein
MKVSRRIRCVGSCIVLFAFCSSSPALIIRGFDPDNQTPHARSWGVPSAGTIENGSFPYGASKYRASMWPALDPKVAAADQHWHRQVALVSPVHFVTATHYPIPVGWKMSHFDQKGTVRQRVIASLKPVLSASGKSTDLSIGTLDGPVDNKGYPVLTLPKQADYIGKSLLVFGTVSLSGTGKLSGFETAPAPAFANTVFSNFTYDETAGGASDCKFNSGDSGSPTFVLEGENPLLIGTHSDVITKGRISVNYDTFVPAYLDQLDAEMSKSGYNIRRHPQEAATLTLGHGPPTGAPDKDGPGSLSLEVRNSGPGIARNLELRMVCTRPPDSIAGSGWVAEKQTNGDWLCRRGSLANGNSASVKLTWRSLPGSAGVQVRSLLSHDAAPVPAVKTSTLPVNAGR